MPAPAAPVLTTSRPRGIAAHARAAGSRTAARVQAALCPTAEGVRASLHGAARSDDLARQNRHEEALADYTAALQVVGANKPMLLRNRAFCYGKLGRHAEALADCEASIEEDPENPQGWVRKVNALQGLGRHGRARRAAQRLQSLL